MFSQGFDVGYEIPGGVFFETSVGCGLSGATLVEEDAAVVGGVEVSSVIFYLGTV
jgi:hypothetical protein